MNERRPRRGPEVLNSEARAWARDHLQTRDFGTIELLGLPANQVEFRRVNQEVPEPEGARHIRIAKFQESLEDRLNLLQPLYPDNEFSIVHDERTGYPALFKDGGRIVYGGPTINLAPSGAHFEGDKFVVPVFPTDYTFIIAAKDPDYARAFTEQGLPQPYAGVGQSTIIESKDGIAIMNRRGDETAVYPGRLYAQGGNPKPQESYQESITDEIEEEIGLKQGEHFNISDLTVLAFVKDSQYDGGKQSRPELVAYLPTRYPYGVLERIYYGHRLDKGKESDTWNIEPVSTFIPSIGEKVVLSGNEFCPPTEAQLVHLMFHKLNKVVGTQNAMQQMDSLITRVNTNRQRAEVINRTRAQ